MLMERCNVFSIFDMSFLFLLAVLDLQKLLATKQDVHGFPLDMPEHLILQFDNCRGENKVCDL